MPLYRCPRIVAPWGGSLVYQKQTTADSTRYCPRVFLESVSRLPTSYHTGYSAPIWIWLWSHFKATGKRSRNFVRTGLVPVGHRFGVLRGADASKLGSQFYNAKTTADGDKPRASGAVSFTCGNWRSIFIAGSFKSCPHVLDTFPLLNAHRTRKGRGYIVCLVSLARYSVLSGASYRSKREPNAVLLRDLFCPLLVAIGAAAMNARSD